MEKIISIEEKSFNLNDEDDWGRDYEGFIIKTDKQEILIGISNYQSCCEDWGYFMSHDDFSEFIGANFISVKVVDEALKVKQVEELEYANVMFVNIETSNGLLQFVAHNTHNGYYAHEAIVKSVQLSHSESL